MFSPPSSSWCWLHPDSTVKNNKNNHRISLSVVVCHTVCMFSSALFAIYNLINYLSKEVEVSKLGMHNLSNNKAAIILFRRKDKNILNTSSPAFRQGPCFCAALLLILRSTPFLGFPQNISLLCWFRQDVHVGKCLPEPGLEPSRGFFHILMVTFTNQATQEPLPRRR